MEKANLRSVAISYGVRIKDVCDWLEVSRGHFHQLNRHHNNKSVERNFERACAEMAIERKSRMVVVAQREIRELQTKLKEKLAI